MARTLPAALLSRARERPHSPFLVVYEESQRQVAYEVSFSELVAHTARAAGLLRDGCGVDAGQYVALLAHNSVAYVAMSLGAMSLGAASLNLNHRQPTSITQELIKGLVPVVLCASQPFLDDAKRICAASSSGANGRAMGLVELIDPTQPPATFPPLSLKDLESRISRLDPQSDAAVFFTGGTTGAPKAVPHTHSALLWLSDALHRAHPEPFTPAVAHAATLCFTPFSHVMGFVANLVFNLGVGCAGAERGNAHAREHGGARVTRRRRPLFYAHDFRVPPDAHSHIWHEHDTNTNTSALARVRVRAGAAPFCSRRVLRRSRRG